MSAARSGDSEVLPPVVGEEDALGIEPRPQREEVVEAGEVGALEEADFVAGVILSSTKAKAATGFNVFTFPTIKPAGASGVEIAGDLFVTFRDTPAIEAFVKYLATAPAAKIWAAQGGFGTGNKNVPASVYPDAITRASEAPIQTAKSVVFDMSDEQPPSFGGTAGQGEWGLFQQFLQHPSDVSGIQKKLEAAAAASYKKGK